MTEPPRRAPRELALPPGAYGGGAQEIMRCWIASGGLAMVMRSTLRPDTFGILLVDLARHAARIFEELGVTTADAGLSAIRAKFDAAWANSRGTRPLDAEGIEHVTAARLLEEKAEGIKELPLPVASSGDADSAEIIRVWTSNGGVDTALVSIWDEPGNWGILLADLALYAAQTFEVCNGPPFDEAADRIKEMFDAEWMRPTDIGTTGPAHRN